jgi:signal transduction histidine kinase
VPEPLADAFRRVPAAADAPVALAVRDGAASWIGSRRQLDRRWPRLGACLAPHLPDDLSFACAPLEVRAGRIGAVLFAYRAPHAFDGDERALLLALARQAAQALERARLYDAERRAHAEADAARARMGALYADAQRAIRARDDVLAIVSHDLRNPLHAIVMASGLLGDATARPERVRAHAAAIERSARRMNRLIRDLLDSSRLEAGRLTLERQPTLAGSLLGEAAALILPMAGEKKLVVSIAPGAEALEVRCDRERILQVLANLLGNAVTFTPPGGEIALEAAGLPEGGARFAVRDTGIGVPAEHQALIFDRYWKSRESRQGTGLGLAIAKGIVEAHGGRIWVESRAGEGATFRFTVPP